MQGEGRQLACQDPAIGVCAADCCCSCCCCSCWGSCCGACCGVEAGCVPAGWRKGGQHMLSCTAPTGEQQGVACSGGSMCALTADGRSVLPCCQAERALASRLSRRRDPARGRHLLMAGWGGLGVTRAWRTAVLCRRVAGRHSRVASWRRHLWIMVACTSMGCSLPARCRWVGDTAPWLALQAHAVHLGLQGLRWIRHWVGLRTEKGQTRHVERETRPKYEISGDLLEAGLEKAASARRSAL